MKDTLNDAAGSINDAINDVAGATVCATDDQCISVIQGTQHFNGNEFWGYGANVNQSLVTVTPAYQDQAECHSNQNVALGKSFL